MLRPDGPRSRRRLAFCSRPVSPPARSTRVAGGGSLITFPTLLALGPAAGAGERHQLGRGEPRLRSPACYGSRTDLADARPATRRPRALLAPAADGGRRHRGRAARCCSRRRSVRSRSWCRSSCSARPRCSPSATPARASSATRARCRHGRQRVGLHVTVGARRRLRRLLRRRARRDAGGRAWTRARTRRLARINALKNAVSAVVGLGTVVAFAVSGPVEWGAVAVLAAGGSARRLRGSPHRPPTPHPRAPRRHRDRGPGCRRGVAGACVAAGDCRLSSVGRTGRSVATTVGLVGMGWDGRGSTDG